MSILMLINGTTLVKCNLGSNMMGPQNPMDWHAFIEVFETPCKDGN
jgi:hypothetical protein